MYSDPQTVPVEGVDTSFARTGLNNNVGTFTSPTGANTLVVKQTSTKSRKRHEARITDNKVAFDPINSLPIGVGVSAYIVVDAPLIGYTVADLKALVEDLTAWLAESTNTDKLVNGEF